MTECRFFHFRVNKQNIGEPFVVQYQNVKSTASGKRNLFQLRNKFRELKYFYSDIDEIENNNNNERQLGKKIIMILILFQFFFSFLSRWLTEQLIKYIRDMLQYIKMQ